METGGKNDREIGDPDILAAEEGVQHLREPAVLRNQPGKEVTDQP